LCNSIRINIFAPQKCGGDPVNFIDTVSIKSRLSVFRFEKDPKRAKYIVTPVDVSKLPSFEMAQDQDNKWIILGDVPEHVKAVEEAFHAIICENQQR
jgi:hypothetical protein